jgi:hypothetical protein
MDAYRVTIGKNELEAYTVSTTTDPEIDQHSLGAATIESALAQRGLAIAPINIKKLKTNKVGISEKCIANFCEWIHSHYKIQVSILKSNGVKYTSKKYTDGGKNGTVYVLSVDDGYKAIRSPVVAATQVPLAAQAPLAAPVAQVPAPVAPAPVASTPVASTPVATGATTAVAPAANTTTVVKTTKPAPENEVLTYLHSVMDYLHKVNDKVEAVLKMDDKIDSLLKVIPQINAIQSLATAMNTTQTMINSQQANLATHVMQIEHHFQQRADIGVNLDMIKGVPSTADSSALTHHLMAPKASTAVDIIKSPLTTAVQTPLLDSLNLDDDLDDVDAMAESESEDDTKVQTTTTVQTTTPQSSHIP